MKRLKKERRVACITTDFERDYGSRTGRLEAFGNHRQIRQLQKTFAKYKVPVSGFVQTDIANDKKILQTIRALTNDLHCHSHTHRPNEIQKSFDEFKKIFKQSPLGYRAPFGKTDADFPKLLKAAGFKFSSSIFPSFRPGQYNNLRQPTQPFRYPNGILELPLAVIPSVRYTISLSYIKLLGFDRFKKLADKFSLPIILIFDMHLHDIVTAPKSFRMLPPYLKALYWHNQNQGLEYLESFIALLNQRGYKFMTISNLYKELCQK